MNWLTFALLAPALYAIVTFVDKYLIEKKVKDYTAMPIYIGIAAAIAGILIFIGAYYPLLPLKETLIVLTTGVLTTFASLLYFKALSLEETSNINIFFLMFPVVTLILAYIFLHETLNVSQGIGFILILGATIVVSAEQGVSLIKGFHLSKAFWLIVAYDIIWAASGVLMKFALNISSFSQVIAYESFGAALGALILFIVFKPIRQAFYTTHAHLKDAGRVAIMINETFSIIAKASTFYAFSLGPVTLVSVLEGTQAFYAIAYGVVLTLFFPTIFKENTTPSVIVKKTICATVAILGIYLLS